MSVEKSLAKARSHQKKGELAAAAAVLGEVLERFPGNKRARAALAKVEGLLGSMPAGPTAAQLDALVAILSGGNAHQAMLQANSLLIVHPQSADLWRILGFACANLGRSEEARDAFRKVLKFEPNDIATMSNLALALNECSDYEASLEMHKRALAADPANVDLRKAEAEALISTGKQEEALARLTALAHDRPKDVSVAMSEGLAHGQLGNSDAACAAYLRAIDIDPTHAAAYLDLVELSPRYAGPETRIEIKNLLTTPEISVEDEIALRFASAKLAMHSGEVDEGFAELSRANARKKAHVGYDIKSDAARFDMLRSYFSDRPSPRRKPGRLRPRPVFIVGMPRSGTSLAEQILSCHSHVEGLGELQFMSREVGLSGWEDGVEADVVFDRVREAYHARISALSGAPVVTDKMPLNFYFIGFIRHALPEARIIHMRRTPEAVLWSSFQRHFPAEGMDYTYDLGDLARFHRMYASLMDFWQDRFPGDILDVDYEELTQDPETQSRRMLDFIGLDWEDAVLEPHKNRRAVRTASLQQVRQKIYTGSSEEWRAYEHHLKPMLDILHA